MGANRYLIKLLRCIDCGDASCPEAITLFARLGGGSTPQAARLVAIEALRRYGHAARLPMVILARDESDVSLDEVRIVGAVAALQRGDRRAAEVLLRFSHVPYEIDGVLAMLEPLARLLSDAGLIVTADVMAPVRRTTPAHQTTPGAGVRPHRLRREP